MRTEAWTWLLFSVMVKPYGLSLSKMKCEQQTSKLQKVDVRTKIFVIQVAVRVGPIIFGEARPPV